MNEAATMHATPKRPLPALTQAQRRLVEDNLNVVDRVARRYKVRCRSSVQHEDLVQLGALALTETARRFDPAKGYAFPAMAAKRVKGAIQDHFRSLDPLSRGQRSQLRELESADREAGTRLGRAPSVPELAKKLGWESERVLEVRSLGEGLAQGWARTHECRDETSVVDLLGTMAATQDPEDELAAQELRELLADSLAGLPERQQVVLDLYYREELKLSEIGEVMGVTESRICQIHREALDSLRSRLTRRMAVPAVAA